MKNIFLILFVTSCFSCRNEKQNKQQIVVAQPSIYTQLLQAVELKNKPKIDSILSLDFDFKDSLNNIILENCVSQSIENYDNQTVEILLKKGVNPNFYGRNTLAETSIHANNLEALKLLIKYKAKINSGSPLPPLFYAIESDNLEAVKILVKNGANINYFVKADICNPDIHPLLASYKNLEILKFLCSKGIDCNRKFNEEIGGDECSLNGGFRGISLLHLIVRHASNLRKEHTKERENYVKIMNYLIEKGLDVNTKTEEGVTVFDMAFIDGYGGNQDFFSDYNWLMDYLVEKGAILETEDYSALGMAAEQKDYKKTEYLLKKDLNVNFVSKKGCSLLYLAYLCAAPVGDCTCCRDDENKNKYIELLLKNGASPTIGKYSLRKLIKEDVDPFTSKFLKTKGFF
jgi:ankyrin repeat protein